MAPLTCSNGAVRWRRRLRCVPPIRRNIREPFGFGRAGRTGGPARKVRVEQEKVEQARFMLTHDVSNYFYRRGRNGTQRFRQKTLSPYRILSAISAAPRDILNHAGA